MKIIIHSENVRGDIITLLEPLSLSWNYRVFVVPEGFESDGVSTPRFLWATISPAVDPRTIRAGIAHDFVYRTHPAGWTREDADEMFYDFCRADGLGWWPAKKAYWGLRLFGGAAWKGGAK